MRTPIFLYDPGGHARVVLDVIARRQRHDIGAVLADARDHVPRAGLRLLEPVVGRAAG
jgi:hypothetical protein